MITNNWEIRLALGLITLFTLEVWPMCQFGPCSFDLVDLLLENFKLFQCCPPVTICQKRKRKYITCPAQPIAKGHSIDFTLFISKEQSEHINSHVLLEYALHMCHLYAGRQTVNTRDKSHNLKKLPLSPISFIPFKCIFLLATLWNSTFKPHQFTITQVVLELEF